MNPLVLFGRFFIKAQLCSFPLPVVPSCSELCPFFPLAFPLFLGSCACRSLWPPFASLGTSHVLDTSPTCVSCFYRTGKPRSSPCFSGVARCVDKGTCPTNLLLADFFSPPSLRLTLSSNRESLRTISFPFSYRFDREWVGFILICAFLQFPSYSFFPALHAFADCFSSPTETTTTSFPSPLTLPFSSGIGDSPVCYSSLLSLEAHFL